MDSELRIVLKYLLIFVLIIIIIYYGIIISTLLTMGSWRGHDYWKYRTSSYSNREQSIEKKVFIKDLKFETNIKYLDQPIYIEKGWKYSKDRKIGIDTILKSQYPYQISLPVEIIVSDSLSIEVFNTDISNDSIEHRFSEKGVSNFCLKTPTINDTIQFIIYSKKDSIGYIKIWDDSENR